MSYVSSHRLSLVLFSAVIMASVALPRPVSAGFEWKGPIAPPQPAAPAVPAASAPSAADSMQELAPVITWNAPATVPGVPEMPSVVPEMPSVVPVPVDVAQSLPTTMGQADVPAGVDVLEGFGTDLPLAIALQQVTPAGYRYSFAPGVNPGADVSWEGGAPWQEVLSTMLEPHDLGYTVSGNTIIIGVYEEARHAHVAPAQLPPPAMGTTEDHRKLLARASGAGGIQPAAAVSDENTGNAEPVQIRRQKPSSFLSKLGLSDLFSPEDDAPALTAVPEKEVAVEPPAEVVWEDVAAAEEDFVMASPVKEFAPAAEKNMADVVTTGVSLPPPVTPAPATTTVDHRVAKTDSWSTTPLSLRAPPPAAAYADPVGHVPAVTAAEKVSSPLPAPVAPVQIEESVRALPDSVSPSSSRKGGLDMDVADGVLPPPVSLKSAPSAKAQAAEVIPPAAAPVLPLWQADRGQTLRATLDQWSDQAGVDMYWSIDYDYRLEEGASFPGTYDEAVAALLDQFADVRPQPYGQLHQSDDGGRVLVIKSYDISG